MPHRRERYALALIEKKLTFAPVVTVQGVRQCGKSVLVRELLASKIPAMTYLTFDEKFVREGATNRPDTFLMEHNESKPLAIDEAQKVPEIFDAIKLRVDQIRRPGTYILLGSTEFSREVLVREPLTGRLSRTRIWPLNLGEANQLPLRGAKFDAHNRARVERAVFLKHLDHGGFPAIFSVRNASERRALFADWVNTTIHRDLLQIPKFRPDPELAFEILRLVATLDIPDVSSIAKTLKKDRRRVQSHVDLLTILFVLHPLSPFPGSVGHRRYFLCDAGLANYFEASLERRIHTQLLVERLSQYFYREGEMPRLYFFRSAKSDAIHLLEQKADEMLAIQIFTEERILPRDMRRLEGCRTFLERQPNFKTPVKLIALAPISRATRIGDIDLVPWEIIA